MDNEKNHPFVVQSILYPCWVLDRRLVYLRDFIRGLYDRLISINFNPRKDVLKGHSCSKGELIGNRFLSSSSFAFGGPA